MIDFCCPRCKGEVSYNGEAYQCNPCNRIYPKILGIPDFRVFPDPYINFEKDRNKGRQIAKKFDSMSFNELIEYYWEITPDVPTAFAKRFIRYARMGVERGYNSIRAAVPLENCNGIQKDNSLLELGCGTGGLLVAAHRFYKENIGVDIAFRWLVIAKKRLEESGVTADLVCCCAEFLPFKDEQFDLIVANNVLEHTKLQKDMLKESYRVLETGGKFFAVTVNRFSITPEPHVRVWGVGFLPRKWMQPYIQLIKHVPYKYIRILSYFELKRMLYESNYTRFHIYLPDVSGAEFERFSSWERFQVKIYRVLKKLPIIRIPLLLFGPLFNIIAHK